MYRFLLVKAVGMAVILGIGFTTGCTGSLSTQQKRDAAYLMGTSGMFMKTWMLRETFDPYNGGVLITVDQEESRYLTFFQDGGFLQYDHGKYNEGRWLLDRDASRMALLYRTQHNHRVPPERVDSTYRYQVLLHTADSLVIGIQGRHGIVEKRYQAAKSE